MATLWENNDNNNVNDNYYSFRGTTAYTLRS